MAYGICKHILVLNHSELEIDLVDPIKEAVKAAFGQRLQTSPNIRFHGFVDVNSDKFLKIVEKKSIEAAIEWSQNLPSEEISKLVNSNKEKSKYVYS